MRYADNAIPVITGIGVLTSIGLSARELAHSLRAGRGWRSSVRSFDTTGYPSSIGSELPTLGAHAEAYSALDGKLGRSARLAVLAARAAVADAGACQAQLSSSHCGAVIGSVDGESQVLQQIVEGSLSEGFDAVADEVWASWPIERIASSVADDLDLPGDAVVTSNACAASNYAIAYAADLIASGEASMMLAGGADAMSRKTFSGFVRLGVMSEERCEPFASPATGMLLGEGAVVLVIESLRRARERGASVYAQILGSATNCSADHMIKPSSGAMVECMRAAHELARVEAREVDLICANGTGAQANDEAEREAIEATFGEQTPPVSAIKALVGHTLGAACALGTAAALLAIRGDFIPQPAHRFGPTGLLPAPTGRQARVRTAQINGFAFGGNNAVLVVGAPEFQR